MEQEQLFVVLWRFPAASNPAWKATAVFHERRLAENFVECEKARGETCEFAIVSGPITSPAQMAEAQLELEPFV